ncbi:MIF4G domain-containing protein [Petromyzon marinus]|uniref:MIF4G domain-containing protein n=1 Tax=Petromyzon marinus TaxID=7757 RepID=A0AAJ7U8W6_PETMA|nr:MIF4G domain-containing protein [Petromyzon marinus]
MEGELANVDKMQTCDEDKRLLKTALKEPEAVDLQQAAMTVVNVAMKDPAFCKHAGKICHTIMQAESKAGGSALFRRHLLTQLQTEFGRREETRKNDVQRWVLFVTLMCNLFDHVKVNGAPMVALVGPIHDCLTRLAQPDAVCNPQEVDCLARELQRIGEGLEEAAAAAAAGPAGDSRMDELFCGLRDAFLLGPDLPSLSRLLLLELIEVRAGGWELTDSATRYYYSELPE